MKCYYLDKDKVKEGRIFIKKVTDFKLNNYKSNLGKNTIEYITTNNKNIPNNWGYEVTSGIFYDKDEQPSPFHSFVEGSWRILDISKYKTFLENKLKENKLKEVTKDILYKDKYIQVRDENDLTNLKDIHSSITENEEVSWITSDNSLIKLNKVDLQNILEIYRQRKMDIYDEYIKQRFYLQNSTDISDLEEHFKYLLQQ